MPKLWNETIEEHRGAVRNATIDAAAALIGERGLASVTMSAIAEATGIGRATLYKYFPDVDAILVAWHERQIAAHLEHLTKVRDHAGNAGEQLAAVLEAFALVSRHEHGGNLATLLHQGEHVTRAHQHLAGFIRELIAAAARAGDVRNDIAPAELASYCLHALTAASTANSKAAVQRLVEVTLSGLRPQGRK